jgi:hypothetical protein
MWFRINFKWYWKKNSLALKFKSKEGFKYFGIIRNELVIARKNL